MAQNDWPFFGFDQANTNFNVGETRITSKNVANLRREWEPFNDDALVPKGPPTGFALESVLGLSYPTSVVGVTASPLIDGNTLYYIDQLGTVFARNARTGEVTTSKKHFTTTLVDPDFDGEASPALPELFYTAPVLTKRHIWLIGSVYGRLHAVRRFGNRAGTEVDFDPSTPEIDPFPIIPDMLFSSVLGDSVVIEDQNSEKTLLMICVNVIVNDAIAQGDEVGVQLGFDISDPFNPIETFRTFSIEVDPDSGNRFGAGVSIGAGLSVDADLGYIFGGTGQNTRSPYPGYPDEPAPVGFVDRSDSLYAIDYTTGEFVWFNQFHNGDVFNLFSPVGTGPKNPDGPRGADVLSPPVLFTVNNRDLVSVGSKGGLYRACDRKTGETVWDRQISDRTGIGGIQAGGAFANGVLYVAGFEGIDELFSDAQFGNGVDNGNFPNAFFATFSPNFWADVEDIADDGGVSTGMRVKVYALNPATGESLLSVGANDFVELLAGAALRHVSVANDVVFVTTSSGELFALDASDGAILFKDQAPDLNEELGLALSKPHHAGMNSGAVVAKGMVYAAFGHQNNPSGGLYAYELNRSPIARKDVVRARGSTSSIKVKPLHNDFDPNGDALELIEVAGQAVDLSSGGREEIAINQGKLLVYSDANGVPIVEFVPNKSFTNRIRVRYKVADVAPNRVLNGQELNEPNPTHTPLTATAQIVIRYGY